MLKNSWLKSDNEDTLVIVNVKTLQKEDQFIINHEHLIVTVKAPPTKGKANVRLLKMFRKKFHTRVVLESGQTSSIKVFRLISLSPQQIMEILRKEVRE
ncbi:MAG: DUF167 domain-containing protein [Promethearchaeota archaeon]